jgi:phosphoglycolate phosphatase-like HAD superfamily hydrolase
LLWRQVGERVESVRRGTVPAEVMTVPGSRQLLERLRGAGLALYLASGTDLKYVQDEVAVLGLAAYFGTQIHGALDDYKQFSKARIIEHMIRDIDLAGHQIVAFGDGFVEIEEVKKVGGLAVGVASDETARRGINAWKRNRLIEAGADLIIGDYRCQDALLELIGIR